MKYKIYLQLFADAAEGANGAGGKDGGADPTGKETNQTNEPGKDGKEQPKYTDADVNKLIDQKFAEWQKKHDKSVEEAKKLAEMNATERAEHERDQLKKELEAYKRKDSLTEMTKTARKMLSDGGITVSDDLLAMMVTTDAAETKAAVDGFAKAFKEAVDVAVKEKLKGEPPKKGAAGGAAPMTKEQIAAIKDPELRQKKMLENRHLYKL